jgi:hypothetical protein
MGWGHWSVVEAEMSALATKFVQMNTRKEQTVKLWSTEILSYLFRLTKVA